MLFPPHRIRPSTDGDSLFSQENRFFPRTLCVGVRHPTVVRMSARQRSETAGPSAARIEDKRLGGGCVSTVCAAGSRSAAYCAEPRVDRRQPLKYISCSESRHQDAKSSDCQWPPGKGAVMQTENQAGQSCCNIGETKNPNADPLNQRGVREPSPLEPVDVPAIYQRIWQNNIPLFVRNVLHEAF